MGYRNVLWYRGGIEAWKAAGQQVHSAQQQQSPRP
jgi:rhodanese-related sulfurtransferase